MTFAEKARKEHPEFCDQELGYPTRYCPCGGTFNYEHTRDVDFCHKHSCRECWEREIPEEAPKPTTKKTKAQLLNEIADLNNEVKRLDEEAKRLEKYAQYENAANEIYAMQKAFENSGFTREEAFKLTRDLLYSVLKNLF
jgi:predicted ribosome quality control (RQC) complex YloA/Tae2 family protein